MKRYKVVLTLVSFLTAGSFALAQDGAARVLPDAPSAAAEKPATVTPSSSGVIPTPTAPSGSGSSLNSAFWVANGLMMSSTIADAEAIARCAPSRCQLIPDAVKSRPALYGIGIPTTLAVSYVSYRIKKHGSKQWFWPIVAATTANVVYTVHAAHWSR